MTQEIIEMARDSGMELYGLGKDRARFVHHLEAFAKLIAEKALAEHAMSEVQRLGQEIEQEPVAIKRMKEWIEYLKRKSDFGQHMKIPSEMSAGTCWELAIELEQFINTTPPQRKPLTDEEIFACENSVPDEIVSDRDWCIHFAQAIEAAHGIKENT